MEATFKLSINELDSIFLDKIKTVFPQSAVVEIKISNEYDETDYLLSTHANSEARCDTPLETVKKPMN
jgi:hypothetical protein